MASENGIGFPDFLKKAFPWKRKQCWWLLETEIRRCSRINHFVHLFLDSCCKETEVHLYVIVIFNALKIIIF